MREAELRRVDYDVRERSEYLNSLASEQFLVAIGFLRFTGFEPIRPAPRSSRLRPRWPRDHALSLAYFSKTSRVYSACIAFREICPFRTLAILKRSGSVGARDFLNLAILAGPGLLPNRLSNNPIVSSLARDMFRECFVFDQAHRLCGGSSDHDSRRFRRNVECRRFGIACIAAAA